MAFDWITLLVSLGIGIAGGLLSALATTVAGRIALNRKINRELKRIQNFGSDTILCAYCDREVPKDAAFCVLCGHVVSGEKECPDCEIALPSKAKYCYRCHAKAVKRVKAKKKAEGGK